MQQSVTHTQRCLSLNCNISYSLCEESFIKTDQWSTAQPTARQCQWIVKYTQCQHEVAVHQKIVHMQVKIIQLS